MNRVCLVRDCPPQSLKPLVTEETFFSFLSTFFNLLTEEIFSVTLIMDREKCMICDDNVLSDSKI